MSTYIRSPIALCLGAVFACGTAASLFWDVRSAGDVTLDHVMTGLVLVGTISSGHMFWQQLRGWRVLPCVGLALLFVAGTFYCVVASAARNAEVGVSKALEIVSSNQTRREIEVSLSEAKDYAGKTKVAALKECASGDGPKCRSLTKIAETADSHYWLLVGRLASSKPEQSANPGLQHAARVFAIFVHADPATIARGLELVAPFLKAVFLEVATVVFFGIGLGHSPATRVSIQQVLPPIRLAENPRKSSPAIVDQRPDSLDDAATVVAALRLLYRPVNNLELSAIMGCTPGEASRRATVAESQGLIIRQRMGRHVAISLKPPNS